MTEAGQLSNVGKQTIISARRTGKSLRGRTEALPGQLADAGREGTASGTTRRAVRRWLASGRALAVVFLAGSLFVQWLDAAPVEILRTRAFDLYQSLKPREPPATPLVAIADIDERSLAAYGQWPWPRTLVARLVSALRDAGAAAIGFDVVFAEHDRTSPEFVSRSVAGLDDATVDRLRALPRNDAVLAEAVAAAPVVLGQSVSWAAGKPAGAPPPVGAVNAIGPVADFLPRFPALVRNLPELEAVADGIGLFSLLPEADGIVRRIPAAALIGDRAYPTLAMELLRVVAARPSIDIRASGEAGVNALRVRPHVIPTDRFGRFWVYFAPRDIGRYHSIADILSGEVGAGELRGRIVLVGTSATGLFDLRATPLESVAPGVEVHAQALEMVLTGEFIHRPDWIRAAELALTLLTGVLVIALVPKLGGFPAVFTGVGTIVAIALLSWTLFADRSLLFDATWPLGTTIALFGTVVIGRFLREQAEKRQIRSACLLYTSDAATKRIV